MFSLIALVALIPAAITAAGIASNRKHVRIGRGRVPDEEECQKDPREYPGWCEVTPWTQRGAEEDVSQEYEGHNAQDVIAAAEEKRKSDEKFCKWWADYKEKYK